MPKQGQRKSGRLPKPSQKRNTRSVTPPPLNPPKKRAKLAKFVHPENVITLEESEDEQTIPDPPPRPVHVKDVSEDIFMVNKCCLLDKEAVWNDTDWVKLGEFSFREFSQQSIRKVMKAAEKDKKGVEWVSGTAAISSDKAKVSETISIEVEDHVGWKKVEQGVERWMREKNKGTVSVKLSVLYKATRTSTSDSSENEAAPVKKVTLSQAN